MNANCALPNRFHTACQQTTEFIFDVHATVSERSKDFLCNSENTIQELRFFASESMENMATVLRAWYGLIVLSYQERLEDFSKHGLHKTRAPSATSSFKSRLVFLGVIFVFTSMLSILHDMNTVTSYDASNWVFSTEKARREMMGSTNVVRLSISHVEPPSDLSTAVCFKTLFGDIDLGLVIQWAAYNRLMGFDHIFMFYRPEVMSHPRFEELLSLPYVTLTENLKGSRKDYFAQWKTEKMCLQREDMAATFDWVLLADIDEYLWFPEHIGVKDFLHKHRNMTYISLGKKMHTLDHRIDVAALDHKIDTTEEGFAVSKYPFYMKHYCFNPRRKGDPLCPTWQGRAKVMVRPQIHQKINVHGHIYHPKAAQGTVHLHPKEAHFMEWPEIFSQHNVTLRHPQDFTVKTYDEVHIHEIRRAFKPIDDSDNFLVQYDTDIKDWFTYVTSRGSTENTV